MPVILTFTAHCQSCGKDTHLECSTCGQALCSDHEAKHTMYDCRDSLAADIAWNGWTNDRTRRLVDVKARIDTAEGFEPACRCC